MSLNSTLRVALVGCGQIADAHLQEIGRIPRAQVVAVCDQHRELAQQAAIRFGIHSTYEDVRRMLEEQEPDVVHVTTPPHTHHGLVRECLLAGSNVYVEKPFTATPLEAVDLVRLAENSGKRICLGHDQLFDPSWLECRRLVESGAVGDVIHIEAIQGYELDGAFGRLLASDPTHWVHALPGGLFQNVMSHAVARIADFLPDQNPRVEAMWCSLDPRTAFPTELRAFLVGQRSTGSLTFTCAARPAQKIARVFGTRMALEIDLDARTVRRTRSATAPGGFAKVQLSLRQVTETVSGFRANLARLGRRDLNYFAGMNELFRRFYRAIGEGGPMPVSHGDATRVTTMMNSIFERCAHADAPIPHTPVPEYVAH